LVHTLSHSHHHVLVRRQFKTFIPLNFLIALLNLYLYPLKAIYDPMGQRTCLKVKGERKLIGLVKIFQTIFLLFKHLI